MNMNILLEKIRSKEQKGMMDCDEAKSTLIIICQHKTDLAILAERNGRPDDELAHLRAEAQLYRDLINVINDLHRRNIELEEFVRDLEAGVKKLHVKSDSRP